MTTLKTHPETLDLALYAGDGVTIAFTFLDQDGQPFPTPGEWRATIVGAVTIEFLIVNDEANGVVTASLTGAEVTALWPKAVYDLQQTVPGAEPRTWYRGTILVTGDVTP